MEFTRPTRRTRKSPTINHLLTDVLQIVFVLNIIATIAYCFLVDVDKRKIWDCVSALFALIKRRRFAENP